MLLSIAIMAGLVGTSVLSSPMNPYLIGGGEVDGNLWPEIVYVENEEGGRCTAVIVGKEVLITAGHCVSPKDGTVTITNALDQSQELAFTAICDQAPKYQYDLLDMDFAICKSAFGEIKGAKPARIGRKPLKVNDVVTLTGYGCTKWDRTGNNNGTLKAGPATVISIPSQLEYAFITYGDTVLCFGDSGGPVYGNIDPSKDKHLVMGINSRTNLVTTSYLTAMYTKEVRTFIANWARHHKVKVCGISKKC